jgi:hypothetical protein
VDIWEQVEAKDVEMKARVKKQAEKEGVKFQSGRWFEIEREHLGMMLDAMTPEERMAHRQASELGTLPGDSGGGFDLLYTPDQGAKP